jgi:hypothetical protein
MEDYYDKAKQTIRYKILLFIWVKGRRLSTWAGKKAVAILNKALEKDKPLS